MDARTERAGKNEAVFREINERISDVTRENAADHLCECAERRRIPMTVAGSEEETKAGDR
jgi:hypothetical protein